MKTNVLKSIFFVFSFLILNSFQDPFFIKRISDKDFRYEFFTTTKKKTPKMGKEYFWFKGGLIHNAQYGIAGELLHGKFSKFYHSNQLAEQGAFKNGLKIKEWKTWHPNGKIATIQHWVSGLKHGAYLSFDNEGTMIERGFYRKNMKAKTWVNTIQKDTLKYKKDVLVTPKVKEKKPKKIKNTSNNKEDKPSKKPEKGTAPSLKAEKKPSFFNRLFSKKSKKNDAQGA